MSGFSLRGFLGALEAGETFTPDPDNPGEPVIIGIIDSGIDASHPQLAGKVIRYFDATGEDAVEEENPTGNHDTYGHGTGVAGIITRMCPSARFIDVRVLGPNNTGSVAALERGLRWALRSEARILNMSLATSLERITPMVAAIEDNYFRRKLIVSSRRNLPIRDEGYPASLVATVGVDNLDSLPLAKDGVPHRSLIGYKPAFPIEFAANGNKLPSLAPGGKFTEVTGTSFATPAVAGIAGALAARYPTADPFELKTMLRLLAEDGLAKTA